MTARPRYEDVPGAPFRIEAAVRVTGVDDGTADTSRVGATGRVLYYEYDCGCGQSFPDDPMIGVVFADGAVIEYWKSELALARSSQ